MYREMRCGAAVHQEMILEAEDAYELAWALKQAAYTYYSCHALMQVMMVLRADHRVGARLRVLLNIA